MNEVTPEQKINRPITPEEGRSLAQREESSQSPSPGQMRLSRQVEVGLEARRVREADLARRAEAETRGNADQPAHRAQLFRRDEPDAANARTFGTSAVQHGNVRLPERLERCLRQVLVTTSLHRIHHSVVFEQANSNYGSVLSVWDRLFGTYASISPAQHERIVFGVRELPRRDCLKPFAMFLTPWRISRAAVSDHALSQQPPRELGSPKSRG